LASSSGYLSTSSIDFVEYLKEKYAIFSRPLGNVIYFMVGQRTCKNQIDLLLDHVVEAFHKFPFKESSSGS
jgi:hypothetical protein